MSQQAPLDELVVALAQKLSSQPTPTGKPWWQKPGWVATIGALSGGVFGSIGPLIEARTTAAETEATLSLEHEKLAQARTDAREQANRSRRLEYARQLMGASDQRARLELLALILEAPESDERDRQWATNEIGRVTDEIDELAERMDLAERELVKAQLREQALIEEQTENIEALETAKEQTRKAQQAARRATQRSNDAEGTFTLDRFTCRLWAANDKPLPSTTVEAKDITEASKLCSSLCVSSPSCVSSSM